MRHALVTFLGRGQRDPQAGYREATYRFPDGAVHKTNFFGLALAQYLEADGVPPDKARCLEQAAFYERTFNLGAAAQKLQTFRMVLASPLSGASGLFQDRLAERLRWIEGRDLAAWQHALAEQYLGRADFVRAVVFAWEALVSRECKGYELNRYKTREAAEKDLDRAFREADCEAAQAYRTLKYLRNALAHGTPPQDERCRKLLQSPERLGAALRQAIDCLLTTGAQACRARRSGKSPLS
ncbi:MAG: hypothetical protein ACREFK_16860 [Stellaceae bacterium]